MLLIDDVDVGRRRCRVTIQGGLITSISPTGDPAPGGRLVQRIDGGGGRLVAGLWDHHIHLLATAAAAASLDVGVLDSVTALGAALAAVDGTGWIRGIDWHESGVGPLDTALLDGLCPNRPVRIQHRTGACWVLNSAALHATGLEHLEHPGVERDRHGRLTGRLFRLDDQIAARTPSVDVDLAALGRRAAAAGVVGVTDTDPTRRPEAAAAIAAALSDGSLPQHVRLLGPLDVEQPQAPRLTTGEVKIMLDDDTLPDFAETVAIVRAASTRGRASAFHAVTRTQAAFAVAVVDAAGRPTGCRIEHGSLLDPALDPVLVAAGITVVTNPGFVAERGDQYLDELRDDDVAVLYRCASLRRAGVAVAAGTDAPYGSADPWRAIAAAVDRQTRSGRVVGAGERIGSDVATTLFQGRPDAPGAPRVVGLRERADLCVLGPDHRVADPQVLATVVAGEVVHPIEG